MSQQIATNKPKIAHSENRARRDLAGSSAESQQFVLELMALCQTLLHMAQKYTPVTPDAYVDSATVIQCSKQFQDLSGNTAAASHFVAVTKETNKRDLIVASSEYRYLRNKAVAGFATIADLGAKHPVVGSIDFLTGLRTGYKRASDIAIAFLDDIYAAG